MAVPAAAIAIGSGILKGLGGLFGGSAKRKAERAEYDERNEEARREHEIRTKRYMQAVASHKLKVAMIRKWLEEHPDQAARAPKEYLERVYRTSYDPVSSYRPSRFRPRTQSPGMGFLASGLEGLADFWPKPGGGMSAPSGAGGGGGIGSGYDRPR